MRTLRIANKTFHVSIAISFGQRNQKIIV